MKTAERGILIMSFIYCFWEGGEESRERYPNLVMYLMVLGRVER